MPRNSSSRNESCNGTVHHPTASCRAPDNLFRLRFQFPEEADWLRLLTLKILLNSGTRTAQYGIHDPCSYNMKNMLQY